MQNADAAEEDAYIRPPSASARPAKPVAIVKDRVAHGVAARANQARIDAPGEEFYIV